MKKTYIAPSTIEVRVALTSMIAASGLDNLTEAGGYVTLTDEEAESGAAGMSRHISIWDEDEE